MHYTVAVITKEDSESEIAELLEPFDEGLEMDPYVCKTKQQIIEDVAKKIKEVKEDIELYSKCEYDTEKYRVYWLDDNGELKPFYKELLELNEEDEEALYKYYRDDDDEDYDEEGNELSTYNPKSKWDWYSIGGRWDGYFNLKNGGNANSAKISDIIWEGTEEAKKNAARFWDVVVDGAEQTEEEKKEHAFFTLYGKQHYIDRFKTKEEYIERATFTCPYAVLTNDGDWVAPGEMHWFSSDETDEAQLEYEKWFKKFIDEHQDYYITLVDCHI